MVPDVVESAVEAETVRRRIDRGRSTQVFWDASEYVRFLRAVREHRRLPVRRIRRACVKTARHRSMDSVGPEHDGGRVHRSHGWIRSYPRGAARLEFHDRTAFQLVRTSKPPPVLEG